MTIALSVVALILATTGFCWIRIIRKRVSAEIHRVVEANAAFEDLLNSREYLNHQRLLDWESKYRVLQRQYSSWKGTYLLSGTERETVRSFFDALERGAEVAEKHNQQYTQRELNRYKKLFDEVESYPLNSDQREAIVHDEDNNLVVAGAGTGKTSTIVGKVAYLLESGRAKPEEILLLAFGRKAADEMRDRIAEKCGEQSRSVSVHTFHSFGLSVLGIAEKVRPSLAFESQAAQEEKIGELLDGCMEKAEFRAVVSRYLAYYLRPCKSPFDFDSVDASRQHLRDHEYETLNGETVKSPEELMIADFLFCSGIKYEYEREYEYQTADSQHQQYRPDFYLSEYGIYLEHFAFDRLMEAPKWFRSRNGVSGPEAYRLNYDWKVALHEQYETVMVATYSYQVKDGTLFAKLKKQLMGLGVRFSEKKADEMLRQVEQREPSAFPLLVNLLTRFLVLQRSNQLSREELLNAADHSPQPGRAYAFLDVFEVLRAEYEGHLQQSGRIDFSDMISRATSHIASGRYLKGFRYVLVDEFQDISVGRYRLIKALKDRHKKLRLFCVGDDWQSIYRFTGSDLSIFVDFEEFFGRSKTTLLSTTYRMNDKIAEVASAFIQRNDRQIRKIVTAIQTCHHDPVRFVCSATASQIDLIEDLLERINRKAMTNSTVYEVLILGRYNFNRPENLPQYRKLFQHLKIDFLTVHRAKGLEADFVIIDALVSGRYGFPSEMEDDPLLNLALSKPEQMTHAEERRLFYVALTRARHKIFLFSDATRKSPFFTELENDLAPRIKCPSCEEGLLFQVSRGTGGFWICNNYPDCRYTLPSSKVANRDAFTWEGLEGRGRLCPSCRRNYQVVWVNRSTKEPFWGCSGWEQTGCRFTKPYSASALEVA